MKLFSNFTNISVQKLIFCGRLKASLSIIFILRCQCFLRRFLVKLQTNGNVLVLLLTKVVFQLQLRVRRSNFLGDKRPVLIVDHSEEILQCIAYHAKSDEYREKPTWAGLVCLTAVIRHVDWLPEVILTPDVVCNILASSLSKRDHRASLLLNFLNWQGFFLNSISWCLAVRLNLMRFKVTIILFGWKSSLRKHTYLDFLHTIKGN